MDNKAYYVVRSGRKTGLFNTWAECERQVKGYSGAKYKKVIGKENAEKFLSGIDIVVENSKSVGVRKKTFDYSTVKKDENEIAPIRSKASVKVLKTYIEPSKLDKETEFIAFIDGSYDKQNKIYGSGVVVLKDNDEYEVFHVAGYDKYNQWNIVGELESAKFALKKAEDLGFKNIAIYHDLINISLWASGEWLAKNEYTQDYVKFIEEYSKKLSICFVKVKAHSTESRYNDIADEAAKNAIIKYISKNK